MIYRLLFILLMIGYVFCVVPFASYMKSRPIAVKLGYVPSAEVLRLVVADQKLLVAHTVIVKVLVYYGTLVEKMQNGKIQLPAEYQNMYSTLQTAVKLDPYNNDSYYFAQAAFTWEIGRAKEVNQMLDYGMKYRSWDYMLPFFAGFNEAYFLKQYEPAARYMKKAAEISGNPLITNLAARYFYESNRSELGIHFLEIMEKGAQDKQTRKIYHIRRLALQAVSTIQAAVNKFKEQNGRLPTNLQEITKQKFLIRLPEDPYGGQFYLDTSGTVRTTSKFAFGGQNR